jgi:hypothetical protein
MTPCWPIRWGAAAVLVAACIGIAAAQEPPKPAAQIPELPPVEDLEQTVERPLFTPTRRPPQIAPPAPVAEAAPVSVPSEESPADLSGIISGPDRTYAIMTNKATKEVLHLRAGEKIDEWSIHEIGPRHVVLRRGPGSLRLELFDEKESKTASDDGEERIRRPPPNTRPRFAPQQQRQRARPNRQPNRRTRGE